MDYQAIVEEALGAAELYRGHGDVASHIPALASVDAKKLGLALVLRDGSAYCAGDAEEPFSIQSISTVFTLSLALQHVGGALWNHVGREAPGSPLNSLVQLEYDRGRPRNPFVNPGAIVVCDQMIGTDDSETALGELLQFLRERAGDEAIQVDETVAMSESQAGALNRSLAHYIASFGNLRNPVEDVVSFYFRQCSIAMSCRQLATAALYLSCEGTDCSTGASVLGREGARRINALMLTCGHYDNSGDFAFRIGLPGKSGSGGGILVVIPDIGAACVWSPGLNSARTSLAGTVALERLVQRTGWSIFV